MSGRGIVFRDVMVRAYQAGRKWQDRRPVRPQPPRGWDVRARLDADKPGFVTFVYRSTEWSNCGPYGRPGARFWIRETHKLWLPSSGPADWSCMYRDGIVRDRLATWDEGDDYSSPEDFGLETLPSRWRPPVCMPRWASRFAPLITSIRVQRLQDITEEEAIAEGVEWDEEHGSGWREYGPDAWPGTAACLTARDSYFSFWDSIYGDTEFASRNNPWIWVCEFEKAGEEG